MILCINYKSDAITIWLSLCMSFLWILLITKKRRSQNCSSVKHMELKKKLARYWWTILSSVAKVTVNTIFCGRTLFCFVFLSNMAFFTYRQVDAKLAQRKKSGIIASYSQTLLIHGSKHMNLVVYHNKYWIKLKLRSEALSFTRI